MAYELMKGDSTVLFVPQTGRLVTIWCESLSHPQGLRLPVTLPPDTFTSVKVYAGAFTDEPQTITLRHEPTWFLIEDARVVWTILSEQGWIQRAA